MIRAFDQTGVTHALNDMIATSGQGADCIYCGGRGVVVRNPFDDYQDDTRKAVVPGTFWVNDIVVPSQMYPDAEWGEDLGDAAYRASVAFVIGSSIGELLYDIDNVQSDDWGWGVFYATDSNAVDGRCRWLSGYYGYDCPGAWVDGNDLGNPQVDDHLGSGWYSAGNPNSGIHFNSQIGNGYIDQDTAEDGNGVGLIQD